MIHTKTYAEARMMLISLLSEWDCNIKSASIHYNPSKYGNFIVNYETLDVEDYENYYGITED